MEGVSPIPLLVAGRPSQTLLFIVIVVSYERQLSLQEIQRREKEQAERDHAAKLAAEKQRQLEEAQNQQQAPLKWAAAATVKSRYRVAVGFVSNQCGYCRVWSMVG